MNIKAAKNTFLATVKGGLYAIKHPSPKMLCVAAGVTVVLAVALSARAALKTSEILDELNDELDAINEELNAIDVDEEGKEVEVSEEEIKEFETRKVRAYGKAMGKLFLTWFPVLMAMGGSIGMMAKSYLDMSAANTALAGTLTAVTEEFMQYRKNVVENSGVEADRMYRYGYSAPSEVVTDAEGNETRVQVYDPEFKAGMNVVAIGPGTKLWPMSDNNAATRAEVLGYVRQAISHWTRVFEGNTRDYIPLDEMLMAFGGKPLKETANLGVDLKKFREEGRTFITGVEDIAFYTCYPNEYNPARYDDFMNGRTGVLYLELPVTGSIVNCKPSFYDVA